MAGRKKEAVTHLMEGTGERPLVRALYRVGVVSEHDARKHFDKISDRRFEGMIKSGFMRKEGRYLYLSKKGKKYCEDKMDMKYQYSSRREHIKHDLKLSKIYLKLSPKQRETWKTETQIRHELSSRPEYLDMINDPKYKQLERNTFTPDAVVYSETLCQEIALESITEFYTEDDISMKNETANRFYGGKIYMF